MSVAWTRRSGATGVARWVSMAVVLITVCHAGAATFLAVDSGFVTSAGGSAKGDGTVAVGATFNYSVGYEVHYTGGFLFSGLSPMDRNNYFVFDLSSVSPATIATATLVLHAGTYEGVSPTETFVVLAPSAPIAAVGDASFLLAANGVGMTAFDGPADPAIGVAMALYGNIEGGPGPLGAAVISSAEDGTFIGIPLSPFGVGYLNAFAGGPIMLAGSVSTVVPGDGTPQQPFGFTGPDIPGGDPLTPMLILTFIPEPGSCAVLLVATAAVAMRRRRTL